MGDRSSDRTFFAEADHMSLVNNDEVIQFVIQLIDGNTSIPSQTIIHADYTIE